MNKVTVCTMTKVGTSTRLTETANVQEAKKRKKYAEITEVRTT
jgi:acyl-[acyl carrier protein]--UDP-N-acetylglucosamine O-acyltransferase